MTAREPDIWPLSQADCDWLDRRIDLAVYDTNREAPEMLVHDMREALRDVPGFEDLTIEYEPTGHQKLTIGGKTLEVGPMASNAEILAALQNPFVPTRNTKIMSISGYEPGAIRDKLNKLKAQGKQRRDAALAKLDEAGSKHEAVSAEIENVASQIEKEADAALQEFAEFSNGGPA